MTDIELLTQLRQLLTTCFDDSELRNLYFDLGVKYDHLPGQHEADKARELVMYMNRHDRLADLVRVAEAYAYGTTVFAHAPHDPAAAALRLIGQRLLENLEG